MWLAMLQQTTKAFDDRGGARIGGDDFVEDRSYFLQIGIWRSEQHLRRLGIAQHDRERLVDFVRHDRGEFTHDRESTESFHLLRTA
jgi:hypothetical protein